MSTSISWSDPAVHDLLDILRFFADNQDADTGKTLVARIYKASEILATFPHAGRSGPLHDFRELITPNLPYFLVYRIKDTHIDILRVMHTSRLWPGA